MNGDVEEEAPRPRPLSAGIWTLFSWLRRADRSSSSESVSSVGSDRTVASFDFLAPLNYKQANTPLVLPQGPLTDTYKKRLDERNLRRHHDRDLTLRRKYGLFTEEGLGYDAFSLPSARRLQKDIVSRQYRERRATSESVQRRTAYVPGKRRAPLPPAVVISATLPRTCKRKRPAPKPPVQLSEENKENAEINKITQMNSHIEEHSFIRDALPDNKSEKHSKHASKEVKLRTDKSFLKQIFDHRKRNSAIDTSRIKLLPSISELDKQAAAIIEANKSSRTSIGNNYSSVDYDNTLPTHPRTEETWMCTTCLRKYKPVVKCCIYCLIKENSPNNKKDDGKKILTNSTQTDETVSIKSTRDQENNVIKPNRNSLIEDKKKLREMLKEMKDSLPKRPKHNEKYVESRGNIIIKTETPTLRIGSAIDENMKNNLSRRNLEKERDLRKIAKETFLNSAPSSSKGIPSNFNISSTAFKNPESEFESSVSNINKSGNLNNHKILNIHASDVLVHSVMETPDINKKFELPKKAQRHILIEVEASEDFLSGVGNNKINKYSAVDNVKTIQSSTSVHNNKVTNSTPENKPCNINLTNSEIPHVLENKDNALKTYDKSADLVTLLMSQNLNPLEAHTDLVSIRNMNKKSFASPTHKFDDKDSGKINERIRLGNVISPDKIKTDEIEINVNINKSRNIYLHTPLKISSLLNPLYCPKYNINNKESNISNFVNILTNEVPNVEIDNKKETTPIKPTIVPSTSTSKSAINAETPSTSDTKLFTVTLEKSEVDSNNASKETENKILSSVIINKNLEDKIMENILIETKNSSPKPDLTVTDHHTRRRNLINQLEQAISKGDEQTAAEAAAKLAKLKLSCSVLSFSSQIVAEPSPNKTEPAKNIFLSTEGHGNNLQIQPNSTSNVLHSNSRLPDKSLIEQNTTRYEDQKTTKIMSKETNRISEASTSTSQVPTDVVMIEVWVEDKEAARGPIPLRVSRNATIGEVKQRAEASLGIDIRLQRWIVGRTLCTDDNMNLVALAGLDLNAPFYLCLVETEANKDPSSQIKENIDSQTKKSEISTVVSGDVYTELMRLEQQALVSNTDEFECGVCMEQRVSGAGVILRECIHTFCKECLGDVVRHCEEQIVLCPAIGCPGVLQDREIRALLSAEEHERWLARGLAAAERRTRNAFHCRTRDCKGWAFCEPEVRRFPCPVCEHTNCVPCQAVHEGKSCEQYQATLREAINAAGTDQTDEGTQALLKSLITRGEALECPECSTIITKKWGCDWVKCSACKTEICWITKGRRWGPGGKGDTSSGCKCGVDGKRCHPACGYCH